MVIAVAGRRIDPEGTATPRFPLANIDDVRQRIRAVFEQEQATAIISSAACGADLIAQEQAAEMGLLRKIVLPFEIPRFREKSVVDRPGNWGPVFDRLIAGSELLTIPEAGDDQSAYQAVNHAILEGAGLAVMVWDGAPRGEDDLTAEFAAEAQRRDIRVREVRTLYQRLSGLATL
jgi:hypothetical protein